MSWKMLTSFSGWIVLLSDDLTQSRCKPQLHTSKLHLEKQKEQMCGTTMENEYASHTFSHPIPPQNEPEKPGAIYFSSSKRGISAHTAEKQRGAAVPFAMKCDPRAGQASPWPQSELNLQSV